MLHHDYYPYYMRLACFATDLLIKDALFKKLIHPQNGLIIFLIAYLF